MDVFDSEERRIPTTPPVPPEAQRDEESATEDPSCSEYPSPSSETRVRVARPPLSLLRLIAILSSPAPLVDIIDDADEDADVRERTPVLPPRANALLITAIVPRPNSS